MEIEKEYKELSNRIRELRLNFRLKYNIEPNNVYVGYKELKLLKREDRHLMVNFKGNDPRYTVFGVNLKLVDEDSCLQVGLVIE